MGKWIGIRACKRSLDGGFENIVEECDFCSRITVALARNINTKVHICKACATEAIEEIDKEILNEL